MEIVYKKDVQVEGVGEEGFRVDKDVKIRLREGIMDRSSRSRMRSVYE